MDLLITLIGNAVVDPFFRKRFLDNPVDIVDHYRFRLTKGEFELLQTVFVGLEPQEKEKLEKAFSVLQEILYVKIGPCPKPPCLWSLYPPTELREGQPMLGKVRELTKKTGTR